MRQSVRMRIAVSGASGLIGFALVPSLEAAGHDVVRLVRRRAASARELEWDPAAGTLDASALVGIEAPSISAARRSAVAGRKRERPRFSSPA